MYRSLENFFLQMKLEMMVSLLIWRHDVEEDMDMTVVAESDDVGCGCGDYGVHHGVHDALVGVVHNKDTLFHNKDNREGIPDASCC